MLDRQQLATGAPWPALPLEEWQDTRDTLHMWTQVVGKVRLELEPHVNHWWEVPLYISSRGLTTGAMPHGDRLLRMEFDFVHHQLRVEASDGGEGAVALEPRTVADFYHAVMDVLDGLDASVDIWTTPVEVEDRTPFEDDTHHHTYEPEHAQRFWQALVSMHHPFHAFRTRFIGKASPVHFYWGGFDLASSRFSGRTAPPQEEAYAVANYVNAEAYNRELWTGGWWTGGGQVDGPHFYAFGYPAPDGYADQPVEPEAAYYHDDLGEFVLPYDAVRQADDPHAALTAFLESTYAAAAELGDWDRDTLERPEGFVEGRDD